MPQRRRQATQRQMLSGLEVGAEIVTVGGIIGHVRGLDDDEVLLEIAPDTTIRLARRAVAAVVPRIEDPEDAESVDPDESAATPIEANPR